MSFPNVFYDNISQIVKRRIHATIYKMKRVFATFEKFTHNKLLDCSLRFTFENHYPLVNCSDRLMTQSEDYFRGGTIKFLVFTKKMVLFSCIGSQEPIQ